MDPNGPLIIIKDPLGFYNLKTGKAHQGLFVFRVNRRFIIGNCMNTNASVMCRTDNCKEHGTWKSKAERLKR